MSLRYWCSAAAQTVAEGMRDPFRVSDKSFAFTRQLLISGATFADRLRLPQSHLFDLFPESEGLTIDLGPMQYRRSNTNPMERYCIAALAMLRQPNHVFEFGTYDGTTTLQIARHATAAEILTLDLEPGALFNACNHGDLVEAEIENVVDGGIGDKFVGTPEAVRIRQLLGDSRTFDFKPYAGTCDMVFVDACHEYPYVTSDTANALRLVKSDGLILWHDYTPGWPGVVQVLNDLGREYPVKWLAGTSLAVLDLCWGNKWL